MKEYKAITQTIVRTWSNIIATPEPIDAVVVSALELVGESCVSGGEAHMSNASSSLSFILIDTATTVLCALSRPLCTVRKIRIWNKSQCLETLSLKTRFQHSRTYTVDVSYILVRCTEERRASVRPFPLGTTEVLS